MRKSPARIFVLLGIVSMIVIAGLSYTENQTLKYEKAALLWATDTLALNVVANRKLYYECRDRD